MPSPEHKVLEDRDHACLVHSCVLSTCGTSMCSINIDCLKEEKLELRNGKRLYGREWSRGLHGSRTPLAGSWRVRRVCLGGTQALLPPLTSCLLAQHASFNETFQFLFWTMFGMEEHSVVDMPQFLVPEFVGRALYGIFTIVMVIVLLNMLIAMITNSFQKIEVRELRPLRPERRREKGVERNGMQGVETLGFLLCLHYCLVL